MYINFNRINSIIYIGENKRIAIGEIYANCNDQENNQTRGKWTRNYITSWLGSLLQPESWRQIGGDCQ